MTDATTTWWSLLCGVALLNVVAWGYSARRLARRTADLPAATYSTRRLILWLGAGYVLGCAFRSVLPMVDVPRLCLHDTALSRIVIGRSVATIAELCFAGQFALLLAEAGRGIRSSRLVLLSGIVFTLIVIAEVFSWSAVLTTNNLLHALENSLWTVAALLGVAGFASLRAHTDARGMRFLIGVLICGACYIVFMTIVDVPMYFERWQAELAAGVPRSSLAQGLAQIVERCTVVREWAVWRDDVPWLTLYFSTAVWISIALAHAPSLAALGPADRRAA